MAASTPLINLVRTVPFQTLLTASKDSGQGLIGELSKMKEAKKAAEQPKPANNIKKNGIEKNEKQKKI